MSDRNYYMVRAMESSEEDFKVFFENSVVAVGWSEVDFTTYPDVQAVRNAVFKNYYEKGGTAKQVISKKLNEVERFKAMKKDDYILVPFYSYIVLAEADEEEIYSKADRELDLANQRRVNYRYAADKELLLISRNELSEGLQRRLRVRGNTIANLFEFKDEIEKIFSEESYSYSQEMLKIEQEETKKLMADLLENIPKGKTNLQTGGIGLEKLVRELMECEGYTAKVLAKNQFTGKADADIHASKEDTFMSKKIFVQVKHHSGCSGKEGIEQIIKVLEQKAYEDYEGYFITSAMLTDEAKTFAEKNNIKVMDGKGLVELIVANLDKLSETTKRQLGICSIPHVLSPM